MEEDIKIGRVVKERIMLKSAWSVPNANQKSSGGRVVNKWLIAWSGDQSASSDMSVTEKSAVVHIPFNPGDAKDASEAEKAVDDDSLVPHFSLFINFIFAV